MAFEVSYVYYDKLEEGGYNTLEEKTFVKRYGKGFEEIPHDKIASHIISQLSRRDIWITDVKVSEFVKKEVKFKETKGGGIVLGGKKYSFDSSATLVEENDETPTPNQPKHENGQQLIQTNTTTIQKVPINKRALRDVIFTPTRENIDFAKAYKLTQGKKYPIYEEKSAPNARAETVGQGQSTQYAGTMYYLRDDLGRGIWARSFCFEDAPVGLAYERDMFVDPLMQRNLQKSNFIDSVSNNYVDSNFTVPDIIRR